MPNPLRRGLFATVSVVRSGRHRGRAWAAWPGQTYRQNGWDGTDIYVSHSDGRGRHLSSAMLVNDDGYILSGTSLGDRTIAAFPNIRTEGGSAAS